jgi:alpha-D-ribose 1-methylphosphonate 5-triphosphate diphosphatase
MSGSLLIAGARAILPDRVLSPAWVRLERGLIAEIAEAPIGSRPGETAIPAAGRWLMPGLVDLHCDAIEKEVQPRPGVLLPFELALAELDRKLALAGITTMYHGISFGAGEGVRSNEVASELVRSIAHFARGPTLVNHRVHVRFELSNFAGLEVIPPLIEEGATGLLSFMDHLPGQGQYRHPERFKEYARKTFLAGDEHLDAIVQRKLAGRAQVTSDRLRELAAFARERLVALAAHDLDSPEAVDEAVALGVSFAEFPTSLDVARYAASVGLRSCVGAPNVVVGQSQDGNLSAREAIAARAASLLCSDYHPASMLQAVFKVADLGLGLLSDSLAMATRHPAGVAGLGNTTGSLEVGAAADLILVSLNQGRPAVDVTIVGGEVVLTASYPDDRSSYCR